MTRPVCDYYVYRLEDADSVLLYAAERSAALERVRVTPYGSHQQRSEAVSRAAGGQGADITHGSGKFLGTRTETDSGCEQRDDARRIHEQTIREISASGQLPGRDLDAIWRENRDRWSRLPTEKVARLIALVMASELRMSGWESS